MTSDDRSRQQIDQTRATNQAQHRARVQQRQRNPVPDRIGERDSRTGNHAAVYPDGSSTPGGQKLSDGGTKPNEAAVAYPKPSGTVGLDTPRAKDRDTQPLRDRCVGYLRGQLFSCVEEENEPPGNIKYLFSVEVDGVTKIYAGGWRRESVLIKTFIDTFIFHASIDNLGGDRYAVNLGYTTYGSDAATTIEYISTTESWSLTVPIQPECHGHGYWTTILYADPVSLDPKRLKIWQNTVTIQPQNYDWLMDPLDGSANIVSWLLPELEYTNSYVATLTPNSDPFGPENGTLAETFAAPPYRIDPTGKYSVGYRSIYNAQQDWKLVPGVPFYQNLGNYFLNKQTYWAGESGITVKTYKSETEANNSFPSQDYDPFREANPWIDVQRKTFTSIVPKSLENIKTQNAQANIQIYKSNLSTAGTRQVFTYKVDREGSNYKFYNASIKLPGVN